MCLLCTIAFIIVSLNIECSDDDIYKIADYEIDWRCLGRRIHCDQKIRDIDIEGKTEADKRDKMLLEWKRTKSHDATYQALGEMLRAMRNNATADRVQELGKLRGKNSIYIQCKALQVTRKTLTLVKNVSLVSDVTLKVSKNFIIH